jgi:ABC-type transport system substrate-binding protein
MTKDNITKIMAISVALLFLISGLYVMVYGTQNLEHIRSNTSKLLKNKIFNLGSNIKPLINYNFKSNYITSNSLDSIYVTSTTNIAIVGKTITFYAYVYRGNPSSVIFNYGDGITNVAKYYSNNMYIASHSYSSPGEYLVTAYANINGKFISNFNKIFEIKILPSNSPNRYISHEISQPLVITSSQIISPGNSFSLTGSYIQPPTATNWKIGYYVWNFGDGVKSINYAIYNTSSGSYELDETSHLYINPGIYTVTLNLITFNSTNYLPESYSKNGITYNYYPVTYLSSILSSGQYQNTTYSITIISNQTANILGNILPLENQDEIISTEVTSGGPYSLDPAIDYETEGMEVIANVYETLIAYNGSSTNQFVPIITKEIPTVSNGGISSNGLNYTFFIRPGLKFANGDPLNVWDVYVSYVRTLLFMLGSPSTPGWILAQDLLPGGGFLPGAISYQNITKAITYDNATQSITFHLLKTDPAFLDYLAYPEGASIMDWNWLVQHGAGITFTPSGFQAYMSQGNEQDYNNYIQYYAMGSGPYMIQSYLPGQSIVLVPNPNFTPIPSYPGYNATPKYKVYIQWVENSDTALTLMENGQSDITEGLPPSYYPKVQSLQSQGKVSIYSFPSLNILFWVFNWNINVSTMQTQIGNQFNLPSHYFANPYVRAAFADAFNYTNYINNLVGNAIYHANFRFHYVGVIPLGMPGYVSPSWLAAHGATIPQFNLTEAKKLMMESGLYNVTVNIPIVVTAGDSTDFAAAGMWAENLSQIDPNIHATPVYETWASIIGWLSPLQNPMPINIIGWAPDYPYPSDYVNAMYLENGTYPGAYGWNYTNLMSWGYTQEAQEWENMTNLIHAAESTANETLAMQDFDLAEVIAVNLNLYIYTEQTNQFWYYAPYMHGVQYEENPMIGGSGDTIYSYLNKTIEYYKITFTESGLPTGTSWSVTLNGTTESSTTNTITFTEPNGTYSFTITTVDKRYSPSPSSGTFTVSGTNVNVGITFSLVIYTVTFTENGLTTGTIWYVNLSNGQSYSSKTNTISFTEPNGTYSYTIASSNKEYAPTQYSGSFTVNGAPVSESITFNLVTYKITFIESGLSSGTTWYVTLNNITKSSSNNTIIFDEPNGSYSYTIQNISGYRTTNYSGSIIVSGNSVNENIVWSIILYPITITENGIPNGTVWSATLTGTTFNGQYINVTLSSTTNKITFNEPNGIYTYIIHLPSGYQSTSTKGSISVSGNSALASFTAQQTNNYLLIGIIAVIVVIAIVCGIIFMKRGKNRKTPKE